MAGLLQREEVFIKGDGAEHEFKNMVLEYFVDAAVLEEEMRLEVFLGVKYQKELFFKLLLKTQGHKILDKFDVLGAGSDYEDYFTICIIVVVFAVLDGQVYKTYPPNLQILGLDHLLQHRSHLLSDN